MAEERAISPIEEGRFSFYVERPKGPRFDVIIAESKWGNKYLKTTEDGERRGPESAQDLGAVIESGDAELPKFGETCGPEKQSVNV